MIKKQVTSSNISQIGHEGQTLYIRFNSGKTYRYFDVPLSIFTSMVEAESVGKAFHGLVRDVFRHEVCDECPLTGPV